MSSSSWNEFYPVFPELLKDLTLQDNECPEPTQAMEWFKEVLEYNVPHGKKIRGESVVSAYQHLVKNATEEDLKIARILGWCVELFQAYFLVTDDIMDKSQTRRGMPCWYLKEKVGTIAINDALLLEQAIYKLLKRYIRDKPYYVEMVELFLQSGFQTAIGQCLDTITAPPEGTVDFSGFSAERHAKITMWKTSFYTVYLPVAIALYMAGISDSRTHDNAKTILLRLGHYYQVQDDYLDCFGDPKVLGKIGTDIQDNKCSWMVINALDLVTAEQKQILKENYGRWDEASVERVKKLYRELDMPGVYKRFEDDIYQEIIGLISTKSGNLPKEIFMDYIKRLHKRDK